MTGNPPCLFALQASRAFGERVAARAGVGLSAHEERDFEDGEHKVRPLVNVRGRDVYVVQSLYAEPGLSANDKLCKLLFFIGALKDACAARVTALVPYLCYARKDRKTQPRDPVTTRYLAGLFESVGLDHVVVLDVHNLQAFQNAFRCRTDHLEGTGLFARHFAPVVAGKDAVVVSPDSGGVKRADRIRMALARITDRPVGLALMEKYRAQGVVSGEMFAGDVRGRVAIIVDDLISTGTTIMRTAAACAAQGAATVHAAATHGLFVGEAAKVLDQPLLATITVTDTIPPFRLPEGLVRKKLSVLDAASLFGEAVKRLASGGSIVELLEA